MEAEEPNFSDDFFHLAHSIRTLHETRAEKSLKEIWRVLAREGVLIIIDWTKEEAASWSEESFSQEELEEMLSETGFTQFNIEFEDGYYVLIARK